MIGGVVIGGVVIGGVVIGGVVIGILVIGILVIGILVIGGVVIGGVVIGGVVIGILVEWYNGDWGLSVKFLVGTKRLNTLLLQFTEHARTRSISWHILEKTESTDFISPKPHRFNLLNINTLS